VLARFALTQDTQAPHGACCHAAPAQPPTPTHPHRPGAGQPVGRGHRHHGASTAARAALSLGADGSFSLTTGLATDGTADGSHSITFTATDAAGNVSAAATRSFALDTAGTGPDADQPGRGRHADGRSRLTGSADGTGSAITQLRAASTAARGAHADLRRDNGAFDAPLVLGDLTATGAHTVPLTARDAAGNTTTLTRTVRWTRWHRSRWPGA
jgi:hypothetical protein